MNAERTLVLGYSHKVRRIVRELDAYAARGSTITVVSQSAHMESEHALLSPKLKNATLDVRHGDTTDRHLLESLDVGGYDHIVIVACCDDHDLQYADARTIMTLLHLREIARGTGERFTIASEMLDRRNGVLARIAEERDVIVDDTLVSTMLTRMAANPPMGDVFTELFDSDGSEIYFKPACDYVRHDREVPFATVVDAASRQREIAIGYQRIPDAAAGDVGELVLNPPKSSRVSFGVRDRIIVLAES